MSIISAPGVAWIKDRVDDPAVEESVSQFAKDIMRRLKIGASVSRRRAAEPSEQEAWSFTAGTSLKDLSGKC